MSGARLRLGVTHSGVTRTGDTADGYRVTSARRATRPHNPLSLLELALVLAVLAVAVAVAVPEYLQVSQNERNDAARTRLQHATRTLELRHAAAGTYAGATLPAGVRLVTAGRGTFCVETRAGDHVWHAAGPTGKPASGAC